MPASPERADELRLAAWLSDALDALVRQDGTLTSQTVVAGCAEFLTQVCVRAFAAERAQGYPQAVAAIAEGRRQPFVRNGPIGFLTNRVGRDSVPIRAAKSMIEL